jgi:hypothetical protein
MQNIDILTWIGYLASVVTAVSLLMSAPLKLRWLNMIGSAIFATYGFLIGALPVGAFNTLIVFIDAYYLVQIYRATSNFHVLLVEKNEKTLNLFIDKFANDIALFFPKYKEAIQKCEILALQTRDMEVIGIVAGRKVAENDLFVEVDYTSPSNRDYKPGRYLYAKSNILTEIGFRNVTTKAFNKQHQCYLKKLGFTKNGEYFEYKLL